MTAEEIAKFERVIRYVSKMAVKRGYVDKSDEAYQRACLFGLLAQPDMTRDPREINRYLQRRLTGVFIDEARRYLNGRFNEISLEEYEETQSREAFNYESYLAEKREMETLEEMKELIYQATKGFSKRDKSILCMYYYDGLKASEIGEVVGLSESRVSQLLKEMRGRIKAFAERDRA